MKSIFFLIIIGVAVITLCNKTGYAQGVCVISEQKVSSLSGVVNYSDGETPIKNAKIKLTERNNSKVVVKEIETDEKGNFEIRDVRQGKYILVVSNPQAITLYIPVKIVKKKNSNYIHISLGNFVGEPCGGGDTETRIRKLK